mmetsp:Transcript_3027/g.3602  ORF Transcript_3027/g.3602 Transcript_3027/m.3602 type:complete len:382 (+) Transcript_3027:183-1328(+)
MIMARTPRGATTTDVSQSSGTAVSSGAVGIGIEGFSSNFVTEEVILDETTLKNTEEDDFDPFHIGDVTSNKNTDKKKTITKARVNTMISSGTDTTADNISILSESGDSTSKSVSSAALPPRLLVKFKVHEEVTSVAHLSDNNEGISNAMIEGTVMAQVVSSDALKNVPFYLISSTDNQIAIDFSPNDKFTKIFIPDGKIHGIEKNVVKIPKEILGFMTIGKYRISQSMAHMPLLLEQKVVRSKSKIQIAIQVRSKMSNPDDLFQFSIVVFIPEQVNSDSVAILTGDGEFDQWKRCITWEMEHLSKGRSFMVSAKCLLDGTSENVEETRRLNESLKFPVMLRCRSKDQISSIRFQAIEAKGYPATVSSSTVGKTYRIVHRLV